jgi:ABC-type xylose transport system substrate-binding protein
MKQMTVFKPFFILLFPLALMSYEGKKDIKIGLLIPTYEIKQYTKDKNFFTQKTVKLGVQVIVKETNIKIISEAQWLPV